ncbi:MAG TPA: hypothetical protein VGS22_03535 [Thermoanaerobaculia bacterium]|jgi:hypothetical protein|nr:hypothetical protein [Thermoanaerobaculia bacterium]
MEPNRRIELAFENARDTSKQLMTLASGVLGFTITFSKDYLGSAGRGARGLAIVAWILFLISIGFGQLCLMGLTGVLGSKKDAAKPPSVYHRSIKVPAVVQVLAFLVGMILVVVFAVVSI